MAASVLSPGQRSREVAHVVMLVTLVLSGCAPKPPARGHFFGKVTADGIPIAKGQIRLFSLSGDGIGTDAEIIDGQYDIPVSRGPTKGTYRVEIVSLKKTGRRVPDPDSGGEVDEVVNLLPPRYNTQSTLQISYDPSSHEAHDFELRTK
jgi:hypothetical protein